MSAKNIKKNREEDVNYWQSMSDVMAALLLVVLLLMMLFILQLTRVKETDYDDYEPYDDGGGAYAALWTPTPEPVRYYGDHREDHEHDYDSAGGGGGGGGYGRGDGEGDYEFSEPGEGDWTGNEKAAVYVTVKDGETGLSIKEAGIAFELYRAGEGRQTLSTYYPVHERFEQFETTEAGTFFLPEKIPLGDYRFSELTVPHGYDPAEDAPMFIGESHDWDEPYTLEIFLFPCRNAVRISCFDAETGEPVPGGEYELVAAADVVTADGTMRYRAGEVASVIVCDGSGCGESEEIYLGQYLLRQVKSAEYYACETEEIRVPVERKRPQGEAESVTQLPQERTTFTLTLTDALYTGEAIADAEFQLSGGGQTRKLTTDAQGRITLDALQKDTDYMLRQLSPAAGYTHSAEAVRFRVSEDGRIDGKAHAEAHATCRKTRVTISVTDSVFRNSISGAGIALYDEQGSPVKLWTTSAVPEEFENLAPGSYSLKVNGREIPVRVRDTEEIQRFTPEVWSTAGIASAAGAGAAVLIVAIMATVRLAKRSRRKRGAKHD